MTDDYLANIDDMNLERILGDDFIKGQLYDIDSKPSHSFWDVLKKWPSIKICLSANQLTLWGVD